MRFLYQKEFVAKEVSPSEEGSFLASLYQDRGHSTDTRIEANFHRVDGTLRPQGLESFLAAQPCADRRTRLGFCPTSPQTLQLRSMAIHCIDINDRVIQYLRECPKREVRKLAILSALKNTELNPQMAQISPNFMNVDYVAYFKELGNNIGEEVPLERLPAPLDPYLKKSLLVRKDVAERITAERMNILTELYQPSPQYDLVVVTNVFLYFNSTELLLSLSNIHSMMRDGGYLVHNEFRPELESFSRILALEPTQARTVRVSAGDDHPLLDGFVIHRRSF